MSQSRHADYYVTVTYTNQKNRCCQTKTSQKSEIWKHVFSFKGKLGHDSFLVINWNKNRVKFYNTLYKKTSYMSTFHINMKYIVLQLIVHAYQTAIVWGMRLKIVFVVHFWDNHSSSDFSTFCSRRFSCPSWPWQPTNSRNWWNLAVGTPLSLLLIKTHKTHTHFRIVLVKGGKGVDLSDPI